MQTEDQIRRKYEEAIFTRDSRKERGEVTVDSIDVEAEFIIKILREVLQVKSEDG